MLAVAQSTVLPWSTLPLRILPAAQIRTEGVSRPHQPPATSDLTIRWPNGATEQVPGVDANQLVVIRESAGIVRRQRFR